MCGIAGLFSKYQAQAEERILPMTNALTHRGPESFGTWLESELPLAFGHRRLAIIDLSPGGHQPMLSGSSRFAITFNGEIFNFQTIRDELLSLGQKFRSTSDTEVILASAEYWGVRESIEKFVGMFAYGLWDRHEKKLWLVRDRLGIKPLYYTWTSDGFAFASEIGALETLPNFRAEIDQEAVSLYLRYGYIPGPRTIYSGVYKLPPGSSLEISLEDLATAPADFAPTITFGKKSPRAFWSLQDLSLHAHAHQYPDDATAAVRELQRILAESVKLRLISDVPVGAFLSGGIDSSLVTAIMTSVHRSTVKTFSIGFEDAAYDESAYAKQVAAHLNTSHEELRLSNQDLLDVVPKLPTMFDEPFADSSQIPMHLVSLLAKKSVTVALSGDGGDELFAGYNRYIWPRRIWNALSSIPLKARRALRGPLQYAATPHINSLLDPFLKLLPSTWQVGRPSERMRKLATVIDRNSMADLYFATLELWQQHELPLTAHEDSENFFAARNSFQSATPFEQQAMFLDQLIYLPDDNLVKVDRASMACALEVRVPLLDHRVVAFAARLPYSLKYRDGKTKWILRELLGHYLPKTMIERPKMGFSVPLAEWLRGPLRDWGEDLLSTDSLSSLTFLESNLIRKTWSEHVEGKADHAHKLWAVIMLMSWARSRRK